MQQVILLAIGFAVLAIAASFLPGHASAFWPFFNSADASTQFMPSASTPVLQAAINSNPNISAPIALTTSGASALVAYSGPAGTIADVATSSQSSQISTYVVRPGDNLSTIANMFGVSVNTIIWANNLKNANDIQPGESLVILPVSGVEHQVVKGDTLQSLAKKYGVDAQSIAQYNGLNSGTALAVGSVVIIPGGVVHVVSSHRSSVRHSTRATEKIYEPYLGGSGPPQPGYYSSPIPGGIITQSIHGWNAVDIGAPIGTPIHAAANGVVKVARDNGGWNGGYGNYVVLSHPNGTQTLYAHMKRTAVHVGETVTQNEVIGFVGMTGYTTGPHVHFEVRGAANPLRNCPVGSSCAPQ